MSGFEQLHPALQFQIVNALGWYELRPHQDSAIQPILDGKNVLVLAPTAGGKTEAAIFPALSQMLSGDWQPLSVVYICPIKALLNNLYDRLQRYAELLGRRVAVWHGDIGDSARAAIARQPPDILLTTPESLEVMLVSNRVTKEHLFEHLRLVIVDEVHAFLGDDRGWQLLSVLERVGRIAGRDLQRVGLSATVGNAADLLHVLAGSSARTPEIIAPSTIASVNAEVFVDAVGSIENAARVVSLLHRGEKRLVFCDSRAQCERLASALRHLEVETFVSHSSLSIDERRRAEAAFSNARDCVIVATSTLELGIDVGDLDREIQIDAPSTVSSFLQRLGRTGRRSGTARNCLFLALSDDAFLHAAALVALWRSGYVEPVIGPPKPYHVFAQQLMSLVLQEGAIAPDAWRRWFGEMEGFHGPVAEAAGEISAYMLSEGYLARDGDLIIRGDRGERDLGYKFLLRILSVFETPTTFTVRHGRAELGVLDELSLRQQKTGDPLVLLLAGHSWLVERIDWRQRVVQVVPSTERGRSRWSGIGPTFSRELAQSMKSILCNSDVPGWVTERGQKALEVLRQELSFLQADGRALQAEGGGRFRLWTFEGTRANLTLAARLEPRIGTPVRFNHLSLTFNGTDLERIERALSATEQTRDAMSEIHVPDRYLPELKFAEFVPETLRRDEAMSR